MPCSGFNPVRKYYIKERDKVKRIPLKERIAVILILAMLVTNPLTGQYINLAIDWVFQQLFIYGSWIGIAGSVYIAGLLFYNNYKAARLNVPAKTHKTKAQAYLET